MGPLGLLLTASRFFRFLLSVCALLCNPNPRMLMLMLCWSLLAQTIQFACHRAKKQRLPLVSLLAYIFRTKHRRSGVESSSQLFSPDDDSLSASLHHYRYVSSASLPFGALSWVENRFYGSEMQAHCSLQACVHRKNRIIMGLKLLRIIIYDLTAMEVILSVAKCKKKNWIT